MPWQGRLCNSSFDIFVDLCILCFTITVYIPQIQRLIESRSTRGLSPYYVLFNFIFSSSQLSWSIYLAGYAWPEPDRSLVDLINGGSLTLIEAFGGMLGHIQIFAHWCCTLAILVSYVSNSRRSGDNVAFLLMASIAYAMAAIAPALFWVFPEPQSSDNDVFSVFSVAFTSAVPGIMAPLALVLQLVAQLEEMRDHGAEPGALSHLSLSMQIFASAFMASNWALRVGMGMPDWASTEDNTFMTLYEKGFLASNYVVHALSCVLLSLLYWMLSGRRRDESGLLEEKMPLLRSDEKLPLFD